MAKLSTFVDDFSTQRTDLWDGWTNTGVSLVGGRLRLATLRDYTGLGVRGSWDGIGSSWTFQIANRGSANDGGQMGLSIVTPGGAEVGWTFSTQYVSSLSGGNYQQTGISDLQPWLRISESGGTITWATSPDGSTWTTRRTASTPSGFDAVEVSFYAGGGPSNSPGSTSYIEVDNVNSGGGLAGSASLSAEGTLGASGKATVGRSADFTTEGSLALAGGLVTLPGSAALSAVGTLSAVGVFGYARSVALEAEGTLSAVGRAGFVVAVPDLGTIGTLEAVGVADIVADAVLALSTVWLNNSTNLSDYRAFPTLSGLTVTQSKEGEVRRYSTGRLRSITKAGTKAKVDLTLQDLVREDVLWLERLRGTPVAVRDDRGRKLYAVFYEVPVVERRFSPRSDVNLSLVEVTRSESV